MKTPEFILEGWHGKESLSAAFWINFIIGQAAIILIFMIVFGPILYFFSGLTGAISVLLRSLFMLYLIWATVGVWRSANHSSVRVFAFSARAISVGYTALSFIGCFQELFDAT